MTLRVVVIGAGGHAKVVIEALRAMQAEIVGLVARAAKGSLVLGVPVLGDDDMMAELRVQGVKQAVLALGDNTRREALAKRLLDMGFALPSVVHPSAWLSPSASMGAGAVVLQLAVVSAATAIGQAAIINSGAVVEHDNVIGTAAHVAPGCTLAGNVRVGARTLVGIGSAIRPGVVIGDDVVIGAGAVVLGPIASGLMVVGCPARPIKST